MEKIKYMSMTLRMLGINMTPREVHLLSVVYELVSEKGGNVSLSDIAYAKSQVDAIWNKKEEKT